jgi:hypothetical protein
MTNEEIISIVNSFLSAKANKSSVWIKERVAQNGKWILVTVEILPTELVINSKISIVGTRVVRQTMSNGTTIVVDGYYDHAISDIFSFISKAELESRPPSEKTVVYNESGFACTSTGKAGAAAGSLIVETSKGLIELAAGKWTASDNVDSYK